MPAILRLLTLLSVAFLTANARAGEWSRFRGPNGSGIAAGVNFPAAWADDDYLWKVDLPGKGHGSPIGWQENIYVASGDPDSGDVTLYCFAAESGEQRWQYEFTATTYAMHDFNSYASATPAADERFVYLCYGHEGQLCVAAITHDGKFGWERDLGEYSGEHGFGVSPMVVDDVVCVQCDTRQGGFLAGVNSITGEVRWRVERPAGKASYATPCIVKASDDLGERDLLAIVSTTGGIQLADGETGKLQWKLAGVFPQRTVSSPVIADRLLVATCGSGGGGKVLVEVTLASDPAKRPATPKRFTRNVPYVPTPLIDDGRMYLWHDRGTVSCLELASGKVQWTERVGGNYFGSPILAGDKLYCLSTDGQVVALAASREYELLGRTDLGEPTNATPAIHGNRMFLRTESKLFCLPGNSN